MRKIYQGDLWELLGLHKVSIPYFHQVIFSSPHEYLYEPINFPPLLARNARIR